MANMAVPAGNLDTTTALIYDSVHAFALALNELTEVQQVRQKPLECSGKTAWAHGNSLINYMKMVEFIGLSGPIKVAVSQLEFRFILKTDNFLVRRLRSEDSVCDGFAGTSNARPGQ